MNKRSIRSFFSWSALIGGAVIFVGATLMAASDAQGAFVYLLALPLCGVLAVAAYFLSSSRSIPRFVSLFEGVFLIAFIAAALIPPLRFFPNSVMNGIAGGFESATGLSPYAWARQQSPKVKALYEELKKSSDTLTLEQMSVIPGWNRICIFGPYSTEEDAAKVLGYYSATLAQSRVPHSDAVSALVFVNDKGTITVIDIERSLMDFAELSRLCLIPEDFPLAVEDSAGRKVVKWFSGVSE